MVYTMISLTPKIPKVPHQARKWFEIICDRLFEQVSKKNRFKNSSQLYGALIPGADHYATIDAGINTILNYIHYTSMNYSDKFTSI